MAAGEATRGYRNCNPGNLERVKGVRWRGQLPESEEKGHDSRFCVFEDHKWGIRALATVLKTYATSRRARNGSKIDTVAEVIQRWAPPGENDTKAYAKAVAASMNVGVDSQIDILDPAIMHGLVKAIIKHECAGLVYPDDVLEEGVALAGFPYGNGYEADVAHGDVDIAKVESKVARGTESSGGKLATVGAAVTTGAAVTGAVVAELPNIAKNLDETGETLSKIEILQAISIWDWLPVLLSVVGLVVILLLYRKILTLVREKHEAEEVL